MWRPTAKQLHIPSRWRTGPFVSPRSRMDQAAYSEFVKKDEWPPNSPGLNPLDYHVWGAMLERCKVFTPKPTNKAKVKTVPEAIWEDLPQEAIDLAVLAFQKRLQACIRADGGHFEHLLK